MLRDRSGIHGVPNVNLFDFMFLLVDYVNVLCSTAMLFCKEKYIPEILTVDLPSLHLTFVAFCLFPVICKQ